MKDIGDGVNGLGRYDERQPRPVEALSPKVRQKFKDILGRPAVNLAELLKLNNNEVLQLAPSLSMEQCFWLYQQGGGTESFENYSRRTVQTIDHIPGSTDQGDHY